MEEKNCTMQANTPLKAIVCFDAVMQTGSALLAARQLFVTPGAIGQQIRKLEDWLGTPLFLRSVRKLQPTEEAFRYWEQIRPALQQIDQANATLQGKGASLVRLSMPPAFANTWFARRMPDLTCNYPGLKLHLSSSVEPVDFNTSTFDLAVRHFDGQDDSLHVRLLLRDEVKVYCSPEYRERQLSRGRVEVRGATLLYTTSHANWSRWLTRAGMSFDGTLADLHFDHSEMAIDAARRSQGLVLTSPWLVEDDLERGSLVELFPHTLRTGKNYFLVHKKDRQLSTAAQQVGDWLLKAAQRNGSDVIE
ncbi:MAG: LysR substrate-binding domain-containing protein [Candidatus Pseudomonas phytovorans]|uniref:LysR substrate-binding domain-containing protein n=1 Tax=Candidatus Pseudomonas phytovorans TaxID=3121377 RepID=A0AAJ5WLZ0_9PSED|nr:LysR substrate-binding domain-containing protein [Pseudomonas sp.]WEK32873.1 MAG: LysR substrate-binding domain-containing protein [Pseudomonas sp.]